MQTQYITKNDQDYTLLVFGPYSDGFDVEIHKGHIDQYNPADDWTYIDTVSVNDLSLVDSVIDSVLV